MKNIKSYLVKEELTDSISFSSLPMKWRDMCYKFAANKNIPHNIIMRSKFKISRISKMVKEVEVPE